MNKRRFQIFNIKSQKGAIVVFLGISLFAVVSLFALVADLGYIFVTKNELQNVADSAGLAASVEIRNGEDAARQKAISFGEAHNVAGSHIIIEPSDVIFGNYNYEARTFTPNAFPTDAVQTQARRTEAAPSGPLQLFFAKVFGKDFSNVRALSLVILDNHVVGVHGKNRLLPYSVMNFIMDENNDGNFDIGSTINIYPRNDAPGNFGFLDLNGGDNSTPELREFIENGFDGDFVIPPGGSVPVLGNPGINGESLFNSFQNIIGEEVFLPVHNQVTLQGDSGIFNVVSILAVKITAVKLNGNINGRYIRVEIINFASSVLVVDPEAPENNSVAKPRLAF